MNHRIKVLNKKNIKANLLFEIAKTIKPFKGALNFYLKLEKPSSYYFIRYFF